MVRVVPENGKHYDPTIASIRWCRQITFISHFQFIIVTTHTHRKKEKRKQKDKMKEKKNRENVPIYSRKMIYVLVLVDDLEILSQVIIPHVR